MSETNDFFQSQTVKDFNQEIAKYHIGPLWNAIPELMHRVPTPHTQAFMWKWETIYAKLMEAREIFTPERGGERRAIYFQNPGLTYRQPWGWASTTNTLYAAVQLLLPGETAPSHRHTQNALRFILQGEGAYSIVQGERIFMHEGDFLTTPGGLWHGHSHPGSEPMIWLDVLDIPTIYSIGGTFFENYPERIEQPSVPDNYTAQRYEGGLVRPISDRYAKTAPLGAFRWAQTEAAINGLSRFEPDPYDGYAVEFINPSTGQTANPTIAAWLQKLPASFHSKAHRHTHCAIYQVYKGSGSTIINGTRFNWSKGDIFVLPNWALHEHIADEDAYLFSVSDLPIMERFNLERGETYEENEGFQKVTGEFEALLP